MLYLKRLTKSRPALCPSLAQKCVTSLVGPDVSKSRVGYPRVPDCPTRVEAAATRRLAYIARNPFMLRSKPVRLLGLLHLFPIYITLV
jgi:hypothetical protein